jgi:hypothetical protein
MKGDKITTADEWDEFEARLAQLAQINPTASTAWNKAMDLLAKSNKTARARQYAFPSLELVVRDAVGGSTKPNGVDPDQIGNTFVTPFTLTNYERVKYYFRLKGDPHHTERLAQVLESGQDVFIRLGDPEDLPENYSHCVILADVQGSPGSRQFLKIDPADGSADWVSEWWLNARRGEGSGYMAGPKTTVSYYFGESSPERGVGERALGRPEY